MPFFAYILYSESMAKYYIGQTNNIQQRLDRHNAGLMSFTSKGVPWHLIYFKEFPTRSEARRMELSIKKRGAKRFLQDIGKQS